MLRALHFSPPIPFPDRPSGALLVAETWCGLPDQFHFVKDGIRFQLKKDGKPQCTYEFTRSRTRGQSDVCRELYFYPVRVVSMEDVERRENPQLIPEPQIATWK